MEVDEFLIVDELVLLLVELELLKFPLLKLPPAASEEDWDEVSEGLDVGLEIPEEDGVVEGFTSGLEVLEALEGLVEILEVLEDLEELEGLAEELEELEDLDEELEDDPPFG